MSFIFSLIKRIHNDDRVSSEHPTDLGTIKDPSRFFLPSEKEIEFVQTQLVEKQGEFQLFTQVETFLVNKQKFFYLKNIIYSLPGYYFWLRPNVAVQLAVRDTVRKISGATDLKMVESIISQNRGIYNYFAKFYNVVLSVYRYSLQRQTGLSSQLQRHILFALIELLWYQQDNANIIKPIISLKFLDEVAGFSPSYDYDIEVDKKNPRTGLFEGSLINYHFRCFVCKISYSSTLDLKEHLVSHSNFTCTDCDIQFEMYRDFANHCLTTCRKPHDKSCSYCPLQADSCTCSKYFNATITDINDFLEDNILRDPKKQCLLSDVYQYFHDCIFTLDDIPDIVTTSIAGNSEGISTELYPIMSLKNQSNTTYAHDVEVFDTTFSIKHLKQNLTKYVPNLWQLDLVKIPVIQILREQCVVHDCTLPLEGNHYFSSHSRCPVAMTTTNSEIPTHLSSSLLYEHVAEHCRNWNPKEEKFKCKLCNFEIKDPDYFTILIDHALKHKTIKFSESCAQDKNLVCKECRFESFEDYLNHTLTYHFSYSMEYRNLIINMAQFEIVEDKVSQKALYQTPIIKSSVKRSTQLFETSRVTDKKSSLGLSEVSQTLSTHNQGINSDDNSSDIEPDNGDNSDYCQIMKDQLANNNLSKSLKSKSNNNEPGVLCKNENHPQPLKFTSETQKKMHILSCHKCPEWRTCHFSAELDSTIIEHYERVHMVTTDTCELCGSEYSDKDQHYKANHLKCNACKQYFKDYNHLKKHEITCQVVSSGDSLNRSSLNNLKFISGTIQNDSLLHDKTSTEMDFSETLVDLIGRLEMSPERRERSLAAVNKYASENLIAKSRLRGEAITLVKNVDLLFDAPNFEKTTSAGRENINKLQQYLGTIKDSDRFDNVIENSTRDSISNFEKIDRICRRIRDAAIMCNLGEQHSKVVLSQFLSERVMDAISGYSKREFIDMSYVSILNTAQLLFAPVRLDLLESRVMSDTKSKNESIMDFVSRIQRHLRICGKRLPLEQRDEYLERHAKRLIEQSMDPEILAEVQKKESIFSPFTSTELIEFIMSRHNQVDQNVNQYNNVFLARRPSSQLRNEDSEKQRHSKQNKGKKPQKNHNFSKKIQAVSQAPDVSKMTEKSKLKLQELGPRFQNTNGPICFKCIDLKNLHLPKSCPLYSGPVADKLCWKHEGGKRRPCGYHPPELCKERKFQNLKIEGTLPKKGNPNVWGKKY